MHVLAGCIVLVYLTDIRVSILGMMLKQKMCDGFFLYISLLSRICPVFFLCCNNTAAVNRLCGIAAQPFDWEDEGDAACQQVVDDFMCKNYGRYCRCQPALRYCRTLPAGMRLQPPPAGT